MRVRTAPPFVWRNCAPGSARCWAGSGHCIRAPNGEQGGIVRSGSLPQGVRPVLKQPSGVLWRVVLDSSVLATCAVVPASRQARRYHRRSQRFRSALCFPLQPEPLLHGI